VAKKTVIQFTCDRCGRVWYPEVVAGQPEPKAAKTQVAFVGADGDVSSAKYDTLCENCATAVKNHIDSIARDLTHRSPKRTAKKKEAEPLSSTPTAPAVTR
jgi:hypothetical protein